MQLYIGAMVIGVQRLRNRRANDECDGLMLLSFSEAKTRSGTCATKAKEMGTATPKNDENF